MIGYKTFSERPQDVQREWHVVDAAGQNLGRLATQIAVLLRGKHKPTYTPSTDCGDFVIVINAKDIAVSGAKMSSKFYYSHSGYPGGLSKTNLMTMLRSHPERVIEHAVRGMLPDNKLGEKMFKKLKVYAGAHHKHGRHLAGGVKTEKES